MGLAAANSSWAGGTWPATALCGESELRERGSRTPGERRSRFCSSRERRVRMFKLTDQAIQIDELVSFVTHAKSGAIVTFIGTTRDNNEGRRVLALSYEAYAGMAEKELERVGREARERWNIE